MCSQTEGPADRQSLIITLRLMYEVTSNRMGVEKFVLMTLLAPLSSYSGLIGCG